MILFALWGAVTTLVEQELVKEPGKKESSMVAMKQLRGLKGGKIADGRFGRQIAGSRTKWDGRKRWLL